MSRILIKHGYNYHIFNRGNNYEKIFREDTNYRYFLKLIKKYIVPHSNIYAYCLLPDHFHFFLQVKITKEEESTKKPFSQYLSNMLNSYAKAYNKMYNRSGSLFKKNFQRSKVEGRTYIKNLIIYILQNPIHHNYEISYKEYPYSSYYELNQSDEQIVKWSKIFEWFGGKDKLDMELDNFEHKYDGDIIDI